MKLMRSLKEVVKVISQHPRVWAHLVCVIDLQRKNDSPLNEYNLLKVTSECLFHAGISSE